MVKFQDNTVRDGMQQHNVNKNFRTKLSVFELIDNQMLIQSKLACVPQKMITQ